MTNGKEQAQESKKVTEGDQQEKKWDNPKNPEGAEDERDIEKLNRQKEEAERRKENLTTDESNKD